MIVMLALALAATTACFPVALWWWRDRRALVGNETAYRKAVVAAVHAGRPTLGQAGSLAPLLTGLVLAAAGAWGALVVPTAWFVVGFAVCGLGLCVVFGVLTAHFVNWGRSRR